MIAAPPPSLAALKPCYVSVQSAPDSYTAEPVALSGSGFEPGERLAIAVDDTVALPDVTATGDGTLAPQSVSAPLQPAGERAFTLSVTNADDGRARVTASARVTALAVRVHPKSARPQQEVRITGRGFVDDAPIYAHYVRRNTLRRTVQLVPDSTGACGRFAVRRPQFPFKPGQGVWRVQVDQHPDLTAEGPLVNLAIDVRPRPAVSP